jgi:CubicO group peptidase (beta-lactamase class C family)
MKADRRRFIEIAAFGGGVLFATAHPMRAGEAGDGAAQPSPASPPRGARTTSAGLSQARLRRMHDVLGGHVERGAVPGLVALVSRRDEVHVEVLGVKAVGGRDPMRRDTIFRIASMTKPVTAVAALLLIEEGKLHLDEPVDRLLPELADRKVLRQLDAPLRDTVPAKRPVSVRDVMTFTLGFGLVLSRERYPIQKAIDELQIVGFGPPNPGSPHTPDEWIRRLGTLPLMHQPGEKWMYNTGAYVLGVLIARASGRPLESFLHERIFEPLGMKDTGFSVPAAKLDRLATAYWTNPATGALDVSDAPQTSQWGRPPAFPDGGAGLVSTVDDYLAFGRMLLNKGRHGRQRILSRPSVETMTTDQLTPEQKAASVSLVPGYFDSHGWGFGVSVITRRIDPAGQVGKFGWDGGLGTSWYSDPREDMVTILLTQAAFTSPAPPPVVVDFWTSAYQAIDD